MNLARHLPLYKAFPESLHCYTGKCSKGDLLLLLVTNYSKCLVTSIAKCLPTFITIPNLKPIYFS